MMSRRSLLGASLGVGALAALAACGSAKTDAKVLTFLNWQDYVDPQILDDFRKQTGGTVTYETYESNDALLRRIGQTTSARRGGSKNKSFDLIVPSDSLFDRLRQNDQIAALPSSIKGVDNLAPEFRKLAVDPGNRYSVPWASGTTGIGYSKKAFPDGPPTWEVFWDSADAGKKSLLAETRDAMAAALFHLGEDVNTKSAATISAAGDELAKAVKGGVSLDSADYLDRLQSGKLIAAQAYSTDVLQAAVDNPDLAFVLPEAGGLRWVDLLCIPSEAAHPEFAAKFIEYYLTPEVSARNIVAIKADTGNAAAVKFVPDELASNTTIFAGDDAQLQQTRFLGKTVEGQYSTAYEAATK